MLISLKTQNCFFPPNTFIFYKLAKNSPHSMIEGIFLITTAYALITGMAPSQMFISFELLN